MKSHFLFLLLVMLSIGACVPEEAEEEDTLAVSELELTKWHTGKFYYRERPTGTFLVNRTDSIQEEFIKANGMIVEFDINWQNDSMYTLTFSKISENPNSTKLADGIEKLVKSCKITKVTDLHYIEEAKSNLTDSFIRTRIYRYR